jgi:hypothetical protein
MYKVALRRFNDRRVLNDLHRGRFDAVIVEARDPEREDRCSIVCLRDDVFTDLADGVPGVTNFGPEPQGAYRIDVGASSEVVMDALAGEFGIEVVDLVTAD